MTGDRPVKNSAVIRGIGASAGLTLGRAVLIDRARVVWPERRIGGTPEDAALEKERLKQAIARSIEQLRRLKGPLLPEGEQAQIIDAQILMAGDPLFLGQGLSLIEEKRVNAEWAVGQMVARFRDALVAGKQNYIRERIADVEFIGERIIRNLMGSADDFDLMGKELPMGSIVVARDLSPADAASLLRKSELKAIVTDQGAKMSHLAILSRSRGIPCVVGTKSACSTICDGDLLIVDGGAGLVVHNPSESDVARFQKKRLRLQASEASLHALKKLAPVTLDDVSVRLWGNAGDPDQVSEAIASGATGIGLFRTEFLFLDRDELPGEEEQFAIYSEALQRSGGAGVTFRTLDIGADKLLRRSSDPGGTLTASNQNPALGLRGIRYTLRHRELFLTQLTALLRTSALGDVRIMFPMVTAVSEIAEAKACIAEAMDELRRRGTPFDASVRVGAMIETPAAAWSADRIAEVTDFFSIGTNDLTQYILAMDRQNADVDYLYAPLHIAVLRAIETTVAAAKKANIPVSICGEIAGSPLSTLLLLGLGVRGLSMSGRRIPAVKRIIRSSRADEAEELARRVMACADAAEAERFLRGEMSARFGDIWDFQEER